MPVESPSRLHELRIKVQKTTLVTGIWITAAGITCAFIFFLIYLSNVQLEPQIEKKPNIFEPSTTRSNAPAKESSFTFYKELPQLEVLVRDIDRLLPRKSSEASSSSTTDDGHSTPATHTPIPQKLHLQTDAFRSIEEADRRRAELLLMGVPAKIQTVTLPNDQVWHRILLGPFASLEDYKGQSEQLRKHGIKSQERMVE